MAGLSVWMLGSRLSDGGAALLQLWPSGSSLFPLLARAAPETMERGGGGRSEARDAACVG